jgi:hypothetical protein
MTSFLESIHTPVEVRVHAIDLDAMPQKHRWFGMAWARSRAAAAAASRAARPCRCYDYATRDEGSVLGVHKPATGSALAYLAEDIKSSALRRLRRMH